MLPLVGAPAPSADAVRYRTVTATGHYDTAHTAFVRLRTVAGKDGSLVLTPFRTRDGVLLVVRGLRPSASGTNRPLRPPPAGQVTITARVEPSEPNRDSPAAVARGALLSSTRRHRPRPCMPRCSTATPNCCAGNRARTIRS